MFKHFSANIGARNAFFKQNLKVREVQGLRLKETRQVSQELAALDAIIPAPVCIVLAYFTG